MVHLLLALLLAAPGGTGSIGENRMILRDPIQGPMPVNDKFLIPARLPDCATAEDLQRAREEQIRGWEPDCMLPKTKPDQKHH